MFENYIRQFYHVACEAQRQLGHDLDMINALAYNVQINDQNRQLVYSWMQTYSLFQGMTNDSRRNAVEAFLQFAAQQRNAENARPRNQETRRDLVNNLHASLNSVTDRVWISATSKLLWCMYPSDIVIYDKFAEKSITVLRALTPELREMDPLGNRPRIANGNPQPLLDFYMRYDALIRRLYQLHHNTFEEMKQQQNGDIYPYDIRILDKLLWMIGDQNSLLEQAN